MGNVLGSLNKTVQLKILLSILIIFVIWAIKRIILRVVYSRVQDVHQRYGWRKGLNYAANASMILFVGLVWINGMRSFATYFGLLSAGVSIALKDPILNFAGWLFIITEQQFKVGDRVEIANHIGDVIDIGIFEFLMIEVGNWVDADQSTGRIVHIPNELVLTSPLVNYTKGFPYIWNEIGVLITFESNWKKAKGILQNIAEKHAEKVSEAAKKSIERASRKYAILYKNTTPRVYTTVEDSGVMLTIRYLCRVRNRRGSSEAIWEDVLNEFSARDDIDLAYPTERFYNNVIEGKPGTKPKGMN
jgi:small-conductance mechanosensitive channel